MITGKNLYSLLPQSSPMLMIDTLISSDNTSTVTNLTIEKDNIFCFKDKFKEPGIIENMAQTAAVRSGFISKNNGEEIKTGYIGAIKNLKIYFLPDTGNKLETRVSQKTEIGNISVIEATVECAGQIIAECEMTIILLEGE